MDICPSLALSPCHLNVELSCSHFCLVTNAIYEIKPRYFCQYILGLNKENIVTICKYRYKKG